VLPFFYLFWSLRYGKPAGPNPWGATGLEWTTASPPPKDNFETVPVVDKEAYCYPPQGRAGAPQTQLAEGADA
jgi:cytochrome c oxidase subunit 1